MPLFDYRCPKCSHEQEHYVSTSSEEIKCSKCDSVMVKLLRGGHKIRPHGAANLPTGKRYQ